MAKPLHRNICPGGLGTSLRDHFSRHDLLNAEGKLKTKQANEKKIHNNNKKEKINVKHALECHCTTY